jgi:predicted nucleic acid-binding Zn ribbon protein
MVNKMSEKKACPVCGKEIKAKDTACSFKCFRILNGINKPEEKVRIVRKNIGTAKNPLYPSNVECLFCLIFVIVIIVIIFLVLGASIYRIS